MHGTPKKYKLKVQLTFAKAAKTTRATNCADYVMWALHDCGILEANHKFYGNSSGGITYKWNKTTNVRGRIKQYATFKKVGNKTAKQLIAENKLKKGDICTYKGHTNVYVGNHKWYDAGQRHGSQGEGSSANYTFKTFGPTKGPESRTVTYIIRLNDQT